MANESYDQDLELTPVADTDDEFGGLDLPPQKKTSKTSLVALICLIIIIGGGFAAWQIFMAEPDFQRQPPMPAPVAENVPADAAAPGTIAPASTDPAVADANAPAPGTMAASNAAASDSTVTPPADANAPATTADALPPPPPADAAAVPAAPSVDTTAVPVANAAKPADATPSVTTTTATVETKPVDPAVDGSTPRPIGAKAAQEAAAAASTPATTATVTTTTIAPAPTTTPAMPAPAEQLKPIDPAGQATTMIGQAQDIQAKTTVPLPMDGKPGMPSPSKTVDTMNAVNDILGQPGVPTPQLQKAMAKQVEVSPRAHQVIFVKKTQSASSARAITTAGDRVLEAGQYGNAIDIYNKELKKNPSDPNALSGKAIALQKSGQDTEAMAAYQRLLDLNPRDVDALTNYLGLLQKQNPEQALGRLNALNQQYPDNAAISGQTAMVYAGMQDTPNAIRYFQKAMALDPTNSTYPFNLGVLYDRLGTADKARAAYASALTMSQQYPDRSMGISQDKIRERLQSIR